LRRFRRQLQQGVARAAFLETAGALEIFLFAKNLAPSQLAEGRGLHAGRALNHAIQAGAGGDNVGQRDFGEVRVFHNGFIGLIKNPERWLRVGKRVAMW